MSTTITFDRDVEMRLREVLRASKLSLNEVINDAVRRGLASPIIAHREIPFRTEPEDMGSYGGINYNDVGGLLEMTE